jgi:hypothetical protein
LQTYYSVSSELHGNEMKALMTAYLDMTKKAADDGEELGAHSAPLFRIYLDFMIQPASVLPGCHD